MSANHVETVNSLQSLQDGMARLTRTLERLKAEMETAIETNRKHQQDICQQQKRTNEALEVLTRITKDGCQTSRISAAKDGEQHMATDEKTTEVQTGCGGGRTVVDDRTVYSV